MVCTKCGTIFEFQSEEMEGLQNEVCEKIGFTPKDHTMVIKGICASCSAEKIASTEQSKREYTQFLQRSGSVTIHEGITGLSSLVPPEQRIRSGHLSLTRANGL
jgi:hypothetical protein